MACACRARDEKFVNDLSELSQRPYFDHHWADIRHWCDARVFSMPFGPGSKNVRGKRMHANPSSVARMAGHPLHPMFVPFPIAFFVGALVTDLVYWRTASMMWETFSIWLITAGLIMGGLAAVTGAIDFLSNREIRGLSPAWPHALGNTIALILALINAFVHSRDGYTSVVPEGLILSVLVVIILAFTAWMGRTMVYQYGVGVTE
jgi:uncharacterized membrane protein